MAADQAAALIIVGTLWLLYTFFRDLPQDLSYLKPFGFIVTFGFATAAVNIAYQMITVGQISGATEVYFVSFMWYLRILGTFGFIMYLIVALKWLDKHIKPWIKNKYHG